LLLFHGNDAPEYAADNVSVAQEPSTVETAPNLETYDEFIMQLSWNVLLPAPKSPIAPMSASVRPAIAVLTSPILSIESQVHVRSRGKRPSRRVVQSDESDGDKKNFPREAACNGQCDVCGSDVGDLFQCQGQGNGECTVLVHMSCIGRRRPPKSNKWRCEECKAEIKELLIQSKRSSKLMNLEAQHGDDCDTSQGEDGNSSQVN